MKKYTSISRLDANLIKKRLECKAEVYCYKVIGSTSDEAKRLSALGIPHGSVVVAEEQSAGRGRRGRSFFSPADSGLYMSVIIETKSVRDDVLYTVAAAAALRRVLCSYAPDIGIKWVNDLYLGGRKIAGILCEAVRSPEGIISHVICGIGINLTPPEQGFPEDIKDKAGHLCSSGICREELAADIVNALHEVLSIPNEALIDEYAEHMILTGKRIGYVKNGESYKGTVRGVNAAGGLVTEREDGQVEILSSGEVSLESF